MKRVDIYTDGACSGNPGPGGWGVVLVYPARGEHKELCGAEPQTTNNRMELRAVIEALDALREPCEAVVTTDSRYLHDAFARGWLARWQRNAWRTAARKPVKNKDLWQRLLHAAGRHRLTWRWTRAHNNHAENERADRLAVAARRALVRDQTQDSPD